MQALVPQFIDVEDKITPFLTMKQFFLLVICAGICAIVYPFLETTPWLIISAIIIGLGITFGFVKWNGRSFSVMIYAAMKYAWNPHLYIYKKELVVQSGETKKQEVEKKKPIIEKASAERLQQIAKLLDARGEYK